jgi:capsular polysaccharide biosynthesis protein
MAAVEPYSGFVQRAEIERLRRAFPTVPTGGGTIYISRRKDRRALVNEAEVEELMTRLGARVVHAQDMSFADQHALFAGAETIVGPHGSGLANLVWAQRARRLVEIFPTDLFNDCYARLACNVGIAYEYVLAKGSDAGNVIDVAELESVLAA